MSRTTIQYGLAAALALLVATPNASADDQRVKQAINGAINFLKQNLANAGANGGVAGLPGGAGGYAEGPLALGGIALIEAGVPLNDPVIQNIAKLVREAAITQSKTYQLALNIIFLDKLGEEIDTALIQSMAARMILGQNRYGGWSYQCAGPDQQEQARLRALLNGAVLKGGREQVGMDSDRRPKLDPEITDILQKRRGVEMLDQFSITSTGDNSNTQFAIIAMWAARRHGMPVENTMKAIEARFRSTQHPQGCWAYTVQDFSAPMTCSGLLGLAIVSGFRNERSMRSKGRLGPDGKLDLSGTSGGPAPRVANPDDDPAVKKALAFLGNVVVNNKPDAPQGGGGPGIAPGPGLGHSGMNSDIRKDLYFLWSLERVCMVFNRDRIGGKDWHAWGAEWLLNNQKPNGSWASKYPGVVDTAFGLMFLSRSNIVRDLTKVLKGGAGDPSKVLSKTGSNPNDDKTAAAATKPEIKPETKPEKVIAGDEESLALTKTLLESGVVRQTALIREYTETPGSKYTKALADAIGDLSGDAQVQARDGLAMRMARFSAKSLTGYLYHDHPEIKRAAALAVYMRDERSLMSILIDLLEDEEEIVWRAAHLALKKMTQKDFGPKPGDDLEKRQKAISEWQKWWQQSQKK